MTARALFRQSDLSRALKAARSAGYEAVKVVIHPDGRIELLFGAAAATEENPWNEWADLE